jgi:hypothetical protein
MLEPDIKITMIALFFSIFEAIFKNISLMPESSFALVC